MRHDAGQWQETTSLWPPCVNVCQGWGQSIPLYVYDLIIVLLNPLHLITFFSYRVLGADGRHKPILSIFFLDGKVPLGAAGLWPRSGNQLYVKVSLIWLGRDPALSQHPSGWQE